MEIGKEEMAKNGSVEPWMELEGDERGKDEERNGGFAFLEEISEEETRSGSSFFSRVPRLEDRKSNPGFRLLLLFPFRTRRHLLGIVIGPIF